MFLLCNFYALVCLTLFPITVITTFVQRYYYVIIILICYDEFSTAKEYTSLGKLGWYVSPLPVENVVKV